MAKISLAKSGWLIAVATCLALIAIEGGPPAPVQAVYAVGQTRPAKGPRPAATPPHKRRAPSEPTASQPTAPESPTGERWRVTINAPPTKPDGRPHDGLSDFEQTVIAALTRSIVPFFIRLESPPDLAVFLLTPESGEVQCVGTRINRREVSFNLPPLPAVFVLFALDLDGPGYRIEPGAFHDYLDGAIFAAEPARVTPALRRQLIQQFHTALRAVGVQALEYPGQWRPEGSQIPRDLPVLNFVRCTLGECNPHGSEGLLWLFTPATDEAPDEDETLPRKPGSQLFKPLSQSARPRAR